MTQDLDQNFFISWFTNPSTVIFQKAEKNSKKNYPPTQNIICFVDVLGGGGGGGFCLRILRVSLLKVIFLCENYEIFKDLIQTVGLLY